MHADSSTAGANALLEPLAALLIDDYGPAAKVNASLLQASKDEECKPEATMLPVKGTSAHEIEAFISGRLSASCGAAGGAERCAGVEYGAAPLTAAAHSASSPKQGSAAGPPGAHCSCLSNESAFNAAVLG